MSPKELLQAVGEGRFEPSYYFYGSEDYRMVEAEKFLASKFLPDKQLLTNYRRIDGRKTKCNDLLAELQVYPMLGERQVFVITDIQSYKPTEQDRIFSVLKPPDPNRLIMFSSPSDKTPKKNSVFFKKVSGVAKSVEFSKLGRAEAERIILARLARHSMQIDGSALALLVEMVAGSLGAIDVECRKLVDYIEPGGKISEEDVRNITTGYELFSIFDLSEKIAGGDSRTALQQVRSLLADGKTPDAILYFIEQHFLLLYLARNSKPLPASRRWLAAKFKGQAARFSNEQLEWILQESAATTASLRRGGIKPELALEGLVVSLLDRLK